ncbi:hypothetical protein ES703_45354 [subsurface metagenome]
MAKPKTSFISAFEPILIKAWGSYQDSLDDNLLKRTRDALSYIRRVYRFKGERGAEAPARIDYREPKNRAGYLAAFGERHAYLTYAHLKKVQEVEPSAIPMPNANGELTVTLVGAGPAIEAYGLCLFYNESTHELKGLTLNLIEKVNKEWQPTRDTVLSGLIKEVLPKVNIYQVPIEADLREPNCVQIFAGHHDSLVSTDLLIIYNVLNEIESMYAPEVLRNLSYIIRQCEQPLLVLLAEPTALKAWPRIRWVRDLMLQYSKIIIDELNEEIIFSEEPTKVALTGVNERLFSRAFEKTPPSFDISIKRVIMACQMIPPEPFSSQHYQQLRRLQLKLRRDAKGKIMKESIKPSTDYQLSLF